MNKNTIIDYIEDQIDYIVLERFPMFCKNTLIDWKDNLIDYFVELIDYMQL